MKKLILIALTALTLLGQTGVKLVDGNNNAMIYGASGSVGVRFDSGPTAIATGGTTITATTTYIQAIHCNTINATASTITITDGGATHVYWNAVSVPANTVVFEQFGSVAMKFTGGIIITAGTTTAVMCQVVGVQ